MDLNFVQTRCSSLKRTAVPYKEVVFENRSKKKMKNPLKSTVTTHESSANESSVYETNIQEFNIKKAKYEIKKFAWSNGKDFNKQKTLQELAIELGAKPFRRKKINYKDLLEQKKNEKQKQKEEFGQTSEKETILKQGKHNMQPKNKSQSGILDIYGKVNFKNKHKGNKKRDIS